MHTAFRYLFRVLRVLFCQVIWSLIIVRRIAVSTSSSVRPLFADRKPAIFWQPPCRSDRVCGMRIRAEIKRRQRSSGSKRVFISPFDELPHLRLSSAPPTGSRQPLNVPALTLSAGLLRCVSSMHGGAVSGQKQDNYFSLMSFSFSTRRQAVQLIRRVFIGLACAS